MRRALVLGLALSACRPTHELVLPTPPTSGVSIALYDTFALVDDRRSIEVRGASVELEHIDPGAALATLVIEPLDPSRSSSPAGSLRIGPCTRDALPELAASSPSILRIPTSRAIPRSRLDPGPPPRPPEPAAPVPPAVPAAPPAPGPGHYAPVVRCSVAGAPGRHLVRILYVSNALHYRAQHSIVVTAPDRATVVSRFAIETPPWGQRAQLAVFDGVPGGAHTPREIVRGDATLDGSIAILATTPHDAPAQLQHVYAGAARLALKTEQNDPTALRDSVQDVWVRLELAGVRLAPGPVRVHVELAGETTRDTDVSVEDRDQADEPDAPLRLPLWIDSSLHGFRQRFEEYSEGATIAERFLITVANLGDAPREVWVEEPLRRLPRRAIERAWPGKAAIAGDRVRAKLIVPPGKLERVGFTTTYRE